MPSHGASRIRIAEEREGRMAVPRRAREPLGRVRAPKMSARQMPATASLPVTARQDFEMTCLLTCPPPPATLCPRFAFGNLSPATPSSGVVPGGAPWRPAHHLHEKVSPHALWHGGA